jgi:hypothetical protein
LRDLVAEDVIWHLPGKVPHYRTTEAPCREIGILRSLVLNSNWIP